MIPILQQTYEEVRRLAIAGSVVAPGDFRLKKLLPALQQAGQKAPVFAKVGEAVNRLVESTEKTSAPALLELTALVQAILYTQGETGADGEMQPIETVEIARPKTQTSARVLKTLQQALTTTGSGRLEVIREAFERGAFHDLRLIAPALAALDDTYAEIGEFVAQKILPLYGRVLFSDLEAAFDPKGGSGHVRRLTLMHRLDSVAARPLVQRALDQGSKEVRVAAIACLGALPEDLPFLLEQAKAKAKDVRAAAFQALGRSGLDAATQRLCAAIDHDDLALAVEVVRQSRNPTVTACLHHAVEKQLSALLSAKAGDKKLGPQNERMSLLLEGLRGRDDPPSETLLQRVFESRDKLAALKGEPSGKDVVERLVQGMAAGSPRVQSVLVDAHESLPSELLIPAFLAARHCRTPAEVFATFSPYLAGASDEKKKPRNVASAKTEVLIQLLWAGHRSNLDDPDEGPAVQYLDPRWLDLAVNSGRIDLVQALARPGHAKANTFLADAFQRKLKTAGFDHELIGLLEAMIRVGHPGAVDATLELLQKSAQVRSTYSATWWIGRLIPRLPPAEAKPKLEALLPTLPEPMIDELVEYVRSDTLPA